MSRKNQGWPYRCNHCGKTVWRVSTKRWLMSYCDTTDRMTRLWRLNEREVAEAVKEKRDDTL